MTSGAPFLSLCVVQFQLIIVQGKREMRVLPSYISKRHLKTSFCVSKLVIFVYLKHLLSCELLQVNIVVGA